MSCSRQCFACKRGIPSQCALAKLLPVAGSGVRLPVPVCVAAAQPAVHPQPQRVVVVQQEARHRRSSPFFGSGLLHERLPASCHLCGGVLALACEARWGQRLDGGCR